MDNFRIIYCNVAGNLNNYTEWLLALSGTWKKKRKQTPTDDIINQTPSRENIGPPPPAPIRGAYEYCGLWQMFVECLLMPAILEWINECINDCPINLISLNISPFFFKFILILFCNFMMTIIKYLNRRINGSKEISGYYTRTKNLGNIVTYSYKILICSIKI